MECHGYLTSIWFGADLMFCCILLSSGNTEKTLDHCTWIWFETDLFPPSLHEWGRQISQGYGKNQHEGPVREDGALVHWTSNATFWVFANWFGTNTQFLGAVNWTSNLYFIVLFKALDVSVFFGLARISGTKSPMKNDEYTFLEDPIGSLPSALRQLTQRCNQLLAKLLVTDRLEKLQGKNLWQAGNNWEITCVYGRIIMDNSD